MLQISFYVPSEEAEKVKGAMFAAGAGRLGNYDCCSWQTAGQGQFRPLRGSDPFIGEQDKISTVEEFKVEMICADEHVTKVIQAMKEAHPYETPAYTVLKCLEY
jgi:hypothetical protein